MREFDADEHRRLVEDGIEAGRKPLPVGFIAAVEGLQVTMRRRLNAPIMIGDPVSPWRWRALLLRARVMRLLGVASPSGRW